MKRDSLVTICATLLTITLIGCSKSSPTGPSSSTVTGVVTDSKAGTPVAGATVYIGNKSTTTDGSGSYSITSVSGGVSVADSVTAPGYTSYSGVTDVTGGNQTVNFSITALQQSIPFSTTIDPNYYSTETLHMGGFSFYPPNSSGLGSHNVKVTIQVSSAATPVYLAFVRPDGYYDIENTSAGAGFSQTITTNAAGDWALVLWNQGTAQVTVSGTITIDFSNYLPPINDLASTVKVTLNYPSISAGGSAFFERFMQANLNYNLTLNISGGSNNDINLEITNPDGNSVFSQRVSGTYNSQSFVATKSGLYGFTFDNSFSVLASKSVTGTLNITH